MLYRVTHNTTYQYSEAVSLCHNLLHLEPRPCPRQRCRRSDLTVIPEPYHVQRQTDYFGNPAVIFTIQEPHERLMLQAEFWVEVTPPPTLVPLESPPWEEVRDRLRTDRTREVLEAYQFAFDSRYSQRNTALADYAAPSFPPGRPFLDGALELTSRINTDFRYDQRATTIATPTLEVLANRRGVCQDFAHLQIGCLRSLGLSARYVSGYLVTMPAAGQVRLTGADASHAWLSAYCPGLGWIDFDPTNNRIPSDQHITLAWGRDYDDVSPVRGIILGGGRSVLSVAVDVKPMEALPAA